MKRAKLYVLIGTLLVAAMLLAACPAPAAAPAEEAAPRVRRRRGGPG